MKKIYFMVVAAFFCLIVSACHYDGDTIVTEKPTPTFNVVIEELTAKNVKIVTATVREDMTIAFRQGKEDIPYISLTSDFLKACLQKEFTFSEVNADTKTVTITNKDRSSTKAVLDLTKHTLSFENYDLFFSNSAKVYMDPVDTEAFAKQNAEYIKITDCSNIAGQSVALGWYTQDVGVVLWKKTDGTYEVAVPLQFLNDVFLSPSQSHLVYNGKNIFNTAALAIKAISDEYYDSPYLGNPRSAALAELCYNELCLNLDFNYGLKAIHGIDKFPDFDSYFKSAGIKNDLMSTNASTFANALKDVCEFYFGDGHSNYMYNSPYYGNASRPTGTHTSAKSVQLKESYSRYQGARDTAYSNGDLPGYQLSSDGKTAIVRFDEFTLNDQAITKAKRKEFGDRLISDSILSKYVNYSDADKTTHNTHTYEKEYDTVAFIYAVNKQIQAAAGIENVVLDLSCNGGGANHSAGFVLAWLLGKCDFAFTNPITGAKWTISYEADVNMNGTFGEDADTVKDKNLFCLISPCSFSCGNMVPAMLKASDRVTILGVTSSGGSSCVQMSSAADGTTFRMSSKYVMSVNKNGSNYDIDRGVEPHYYINVPANFYNIGTIDTLVKNINSGKLGVSTSSNS